MPDDLPPLQEQPDSTDIPDLGQLQHASRWARTFGGSDTNIAERARHNDDITAYAQALQEQRAAQQTALLQTNKTAQDLYLGTMRLQQQHDIASANMGLAQARLAATGAVEKRKAAEATAQASDTAGFNQQVADLITSGVKPQTPEWHAGIADGLAKFSHADPRDVSRYGSQLFPGEQLSPDEILSRVNQIQSANPNIRATVNSDGKTSVVSNPAAINPAQHRAAIADQMKDDRLRDSELEKQIGDLMSGNHWLKTTTGPFDVNGQKYFGNSSKDDKIESLPRATPANQSAYDRYNAALTERSIIAQRHQGLQQKMSELYTGEPAPAVSPAPAAPAYTDPAQVKSDFQAGKLTRDQAAGILQNKFGHAP